MDYQNRQNRRNKRLKKLGGHIPTVKKKKLIYKHPDPNHGDSNCILEDIFDPEHNINAGVKYYKQLLAKFKGDVKLALAAYNAGAKNVLKYQGIPPFKSTQYYVKKVFEYYQYYKMDMAERIGNA